MRAQLEQRAEQSCFCARPLRDGEADSLASLVVGNGVRRKMAASLRGAVFRLHVPTSGAVFRAHLRWPTSEEAAHDRFTTIRWGSVKTMSRCRGEAAAAANSLRIRRFAGRLAKPFAGEKPPALVILQMEYSE
ncbi:MAG: hypothetical protein H0Z34_14130 [Brevibacillus sp.]|nr:hypothetical protein [Brevibacillus sp.]